MTYELTRQHIAKEIERLFDNIPHVGMIADPYYCRKITDDCINSKMPLIEMLSKHPGWDERNLRVCIDAQQERIKDPGLARGWLCSMANEIVRNTADDDPLHNVASYIGAYPNEFVEPLSESTINYIKGWHPSLQEVKCKAGTKPSKTVRNLLRQYDFEEKLKGKDVQVTGVNPNTGEVTQKDSLARVNRYLTEFFDALSPLVTTVKTCLSVNPMDFLYMSHGNSWGSCHYIPDERFDDRHWGVGGRYSNYCGGWSAGCWSYALDSMTMILFSVKEEDMYTDLTHSPKYERQVFFWNGGTLVGSRCYPQNDNQNSPCYSEHRHLVEGIIADCLGEANMWKKLPSPVGYVSHGRHYRDYAPTRYPAFTFSGREDDADMNFVIGSDGAFCVYTGEELCDNGAPYNTHVVNYEQTCACCGEYFEESELYEVVGSDGEDLLVCWSCRENNYRYDADAEEYFYCDDYEWGYVQNYGYVRQETLDYSGRFFYCEHCNEWYWDGNEDEHVLHDGTVVCGGCIDSGDYTYCDRCGEWYPNDETHRIAGTGEYICDDCLEADDSLALCEGCGEVYPVDELQDDGYGSTVCHGCLQYGREHRCAECGEPLYMATLKNRVTLEDGSRVLVCITCSALHYGYCNTCATIHRKEKLEPVKLPPYSWSSDRTPRSVTCCPECAARWRNQYPELNVFTTNEEEVA